MVLRSMMSEFPPNSPSGCAEWPTAVRSGCTRLPLDMHHLHIGEVGACVVPYDRGHKHSLWKVPPLPYPHQRPRRSPDVRPFARRAQVRPHGVVGRAV